MPNAEQAVLTAIDSRLSKLVAETEAVNRRLMALERPERKPLLRRLLDVLLRRDKER
jgi:hypothetical protein